MAGELDKILNKDNSAIEVYKADFATPETFDAMRFWLQGELNRIQAGFISTDEVIKILAGAIGEPEDGAEGPQGPQGEQGEQGEPGRGIAVFKQPEEPSGALAGDVWFKTRFV